ncbi:MAG: alkaline phosphatase family protein [Oscillospiraceae bacterium]|nr:alkaline phosphatase family protein [Oscillospiraceae bacterium]
MKYKRVAILGVDGAGNFFSRTETPCMDELFADGAVTYNAMSALPTISAQCWGSMLLGVEPEIHGLTNDIIRSGVPHAPDSPYPSIFRVAREAMPEAELASILNWCPINWGIVEKNLGVHEDTAKSDAAVCGLVLDYLDAHDPALLFVHFDEVDHVGGESGFGKAESLKKITETDALIGKIVAKYRERGYADDTLFIVCADHGGNGFGHGGDSDEEKLIFIGCAGRGVKPGTIGEMNLRDIAAVTAYALGLEAPGVWTAKVPTGIFADAGGDF